MATIDIKRSTATILSPTIDDSSRLTKSLNGNDYITLNFSLDSFTEILVGDYISWDGVTYTCSEAPSFKKVSAANYEYQVRFDGPQYKLGNALVLFSGQGDFHLNGTAEDFIDQIVDNLNRVYGGGTYSTGTVPSTDYKNLHFDNENCLGVLQRICDEFDLEYYFTGSGLIINLATAIGNSTGLTFQYHSGLQNIRRAKVNDKDLITRLYAFGSERNIETSYGSKRLVLPSGTYPNGYMDQNVSSYGIREAAKNFDDIYPHFEGVVDSSSANNKIIDAAIDFNLNDYLIEGVVAKIVFNTGDLAGYEFEITEFNNTTKEVTFKEYTDEAGFTIPSASFNPSAGDKFTFVDIKMPAAYFTAAESALETAASDYLDEMSDPNVIYDIAMDWHNLKASSTTLDVGDTITITDTQLASGGVSFRILELTQSIAEQYKYSVKVGQGILVNYFKKVAGEQTRISQEVTVNRVDQIRDIRREYLRIQELSDTIFDPDGYFDPVNIKPLSIETGMLQVGMKSQQFVLTGCEFQPNYLGNQNRLEISAGTLVHFTIDTSIKTWNISSYSYSSFVTGTTYYVYAKCERSTSTGVFLVSSTQYKVDYGSTDYYFLVGVLHAASGGARALSLTYGHTTVNGKFITTGVIKSQSGACQIDLDNNTISGPITFDSGSSGYGNISDKPTDLAGINSGEGSKLAGIADNADVTNYADYRVSNSQLENDVLTIANPQGATYNNSDPSNVGAIKITLPQSWSNTMMKMEVNVFNYYTSKSFKALVGGYNYTGELWANTFAQIIGNTAANNRIRFGHDGTKCCIIIGETASGWNYLKVAVKNFQAGHSNYSIGQWDDGWAVSVISSLTGITFTSDFSDALLDAKAILNQGALATQSAADWSTQVSGAGKPEDNSQANLPTYRTVMPYHFQDGENGGNGMYVNFATVADSDNGTTRTLTAITNDPQIIAPNLSIKGLDAYIIRARIKLISGSFDGTVYYATAGHGYSASYRKIISPPPTGVWTEVEFDMRNLTAGGTDYLDNIITSIRLDFGGSLDGQVAVDWISFGAYGVINQVKTFYSSTEPNSGYSPGDLWYNEGNQELKRWNGSTWVLVSTMSPYFNAALGWNFRGSDAGWTKYSCSSASSDNGATQTYTTTNSAFISKQGFRVGGKDCYIDRCGSSMGSGLDLHWVARAW